MDQLKSFLDASVSDLTLELPHGRLETHCAGKVRTLDVQIHTLEWSDLCGALALLPLDVWQTAGAVAAVHVPGQLGEPNTSLQLKDILSALEEVDRQALADEGETYLEVEMLNRAGNRAELYLLAEWSTNTHTCKVTVRYEWSDAVAPVCAPTLALEALLSYLMTPLADWECV
jgi:hypothetical protein